MKFRNPVNGHIEERGLAWLWTLLFGGFYFIINGLFAPLIVWILITVPLYATLGAPATVIVFLINIVFAAMAGGMVRASYLRKGWIEITANGTVSGQTATKFRKCPFCAEEVLAEAIKCKHCKSDIDPVEIADDAEKPQETTILEKPEGMSIGEWRERVMACYGVSQSGGSYLYQGESFPSFSLLVDALKTRSAE